MIPLHCALAAGHSHIAALLIKAGSPLTSVDKKGRSPLLLATYSGELSLVEMLLPQAKKCEERWCPLHVAAALRYTHILERLINAGHPVTVKKPDTGLTPLHLAASFGREDVASRLIAAKADVNAVTAQGVTPLHASAAKGKIGLIALLIKAGAKLEAVTRSGDTPLHLAAAEGEAQGIKGLLAVKASLKQNKAGLTPVHVATKSGENSIAKALSQYERGNLAEALPLLAKHAPRVVARKMASKLHEAVDNHQLESIIELLVFSNKLLYQTYGYGGTPLENAAIKHDVLVAKMLLRLGADSSFMGMPRSLNFMNSL